MKKEVKEFRVLVVAAFLMYVFSIPSVARTGMPGGEDLNCIEFPTPGDPLGSNCQCFVESCLEYEWSGVSICVGKKVNDPCDKPTGLSYEFDIQDSVFVNPIGEYGSLLPQSSFWANYSFHHLYDSCRVIYRFVELVQGSNRIELANWLYGRYEKTKTASELSDMSRSKSFVISGDTISYAHSVRWFDPRLGYREQLVDNFYCTDTLTYTVSAVNESTLQRIDIETLTIWSDGSHIVTTGGSPIGVVKWVPPGSWNSVNAYIDVTLTVAGNGDYYPARSDNISGRASTALTEPFYSGYYQQFNEPYSGGGGLE